MPILQAETLPEVTEQELEDMELYALCESVWVTPEDLMESCLIIQTKDAEHVKFRLNRTQRDILAVMKQLWLDGIPVRLIILKARQEGVSTFIQGLFFALVTNNTHMTMWVIAHDRESSGNLFGMSERFLDNLDERITPMVRNRDKKRIRFDNPDPKKRKNDPGLDSKVFVDQAKNVNAGRSDTIQLLHISERAFWPSTKTVTSLMQAVPSHSKTIVVQESTANGVSDAGGFYDAWKANYGKRDATWRCLFFPWFIHADYQMSVPESFKGDDGRMVLVMDEDKGMREADLRAGIEYVNVWGEREMHYINDEQLMWRRWAIAERCSGDVGVFLQEFPSTPEEAFVSSGRPWFSRMGMEAIGKDITPPIAIGTFRTPTPEWFGPTTESGLWREDHFHMQESRRGVAHPEWVADDTGDWWLWRLPEPGHEYLVAIDTAEGGEDGNKAAIQIFDRASLEQVAEFNGFLDTDLLAHQAAMACAYYNLAWAIPEVNNTGYGFMVTFPKLWRKIYFRKDPDAPINRTATWRYGFYTDTATRNVLVTRGQNYVREELVTIHSSRLFMEMATFVKDKRGIPRASGRNNDDLVMSFLMILELAETRPVPLVKEQRPVTLLDDRSFQEHRRRMRNRDYGAKTFRR